MGPTKGSHLVVDCPALYEALGERMVYYEHKDGRVCIVFRFLDKVIMGSTDIAIDDPDSATCEENEVEYMMTTLRGVFPGIEIRRDQVVYKYCGVRPLPAADSNTTGRVSRDHTIETLEPGGGRTFPIVCLIGGKWTTFRALAEQTADRVLAGLDLPRRVSTNELPIGGGQGYPKDASARKEWIQRIATESGLPLERIETLADRYGARAETYAREAAPETETSLKSLPEYSAGEIERIVAEEYVEHLTDLICRRSLIAILGRARPEILKELAEVAGRVLGWDTERKRQEVEQALREVSV